MIKAELISHMGTDLTVVNAARVSFDKESEWEGDPEVLDHDGDVMVASTEHLSVADTKLIHYLANHQHITPFTHPQITLRETVPIFVARQRFKHVVGFTYNEVSRRYVDTPPEFYIPQKWRNRPEGSVKQGSGDKPVKHQLYVMSRYEVLLQKANQLYQDMLELNVAPEQARMVLPQSMLTSYYVTGSLAAFARAYKLRINPHAQQEIQELAKQWGTIISALYPVSWAALIGGNQ